MNEWLEDLGRRFIDAAARRKVHLSPPELDPGVADQILELARVAAHTRERRFAPLASFLAGAAVEKLRQAAPGTDASEAAGFVREVREELEGEAPPA